MHITSFGCSLTYGTELSDAGNGLRMFSSFLTWPALISKDLGASYLSCAIGGCGNLSILEQVLKCVFMPYEMVIINWTFIDRFDYSDPAGKHFDKGSNSFLTASPGKSDEVSKFYFRHMHSDYRDKITNLIYIKTAIDHLVSAGTRFVMTSIDSVLLCQKWHAPPHVVKLQDAVRPYIHDFEGSNFLDWSRHRGFEISPTGHPLEEAHAAAAELMLPKIKQILEPGVDKK